MWSLGFFLKKTMPYMATVRPCGHGLNTLGVPSRMNIGQILEVHLGWAAHGLGQRYKLTSTSGMPRMPQGHDGCLPGHRDRRKGENADEDSLKKMIRAVRNGIHVATPVFDGAKESDVKDLLEGQNFASWCQTILFDGRTGEPSKPR